MSDVTGAILVLGRDLVMVPKLIHPLPPAGPGTPKSPAYGEPIEEEPPTPHPMTDTWMQVQVKMIPQCHAHHGPGLLCITVHAKISCSKWDVLPTASSWSCLLAFVLTAQQEMYFWISTCYASCVCTVAHGIMCLICVYSWNKCCRSYINCSTLLLLC